jgi:hypothetical protein
MSLTEKQQNDLAAIISEFLPEHTGFALMYGTCGVHEGSLITNMPERSLKSVLTSVIKDAKCVRSVKREVQQ